MKNLRKLSIQVICMAFISFLHADMDVTIENKTNDYTLYFYSDYSVKVGPGENHTLTLTDHETLKMGMDSDSNPTPWKYYGFGLGGISYSIDPSSGQSNFSFGFGPASVAPSTTPPTITLSGGVSMEGTDDWASGISLQPHGTSDPTTVTLTE